MKTKKIKRLSIVMSLLLLFNSLGMFAADTVVQNEIIDSSLTENAVNTSYTTEYLQSRMGKYYSESEDAFYYTDVYYSDSLQLRANCYGYALRLFYAPELFPSLYYGHYYLQQPGEFASKSATNPLRIYENNGGMVGDEIASVANRTALVSFYRTGAYYYATCEDKAFYLGQLIMADAATLGYTVTEYTGTTIPDATTNTNKRLIAVVAGPGDYHFYMQHSDNTWSHKRGNSVPQNTCIECSNNVLTNANIRTHACEGDDYEGGVVKFYYITKNAIVDFKHRDGTADTSSLTYPISTDLAGDHEYAAIDIGYFPEEYQEGCLDYAGDVDYYSIFTSDAETRTVYANIANEYTIKLTVYKNGTVIATESAASNVSVTVDFEADSQYYIAITSTDFYVYEYGLIYDFW